MLRLKRKHKRADSPIMRIRDLRQRIFERTYNRISPSGFRTNRILQYPSRMILLGFSIAIVIGTILLVLPFATINHGSLSIVDALFTATSATCVTGLIVVDTGTAFTTFGQVVILILIQIGGLGIMTLSTFFVYLISGHLSITEREILIDTLSQNTAADLTRLLKTVFLFTIIIEAVGWCFLTVRFMSTYHFQDAAYYGLFHAISAFCNAGFSLYSDSFMGFQNDLLINLVGGGLIVLGGLGFIVLFDLYKNIISSKHPFKLSFHTRIVLSSTIVLIFFGFLIFWGLEYTNSLRTLSLDGKIMASLFQSITTRTAGFNSVDIQSLTNSTLFVFILLMFVGASPGSCGGGIKTTTFVVLMGAIASKFRIREDVNIYYRRIPNDTVSRVISIVFFSLFIVIVFTLLLLIVELPKIPHAETRGLFLEYFFEVVSAFGTVGLSTGVTPNLSPAGKLLITLTMFIGRLGPLTVALAVRGKELAPKYKYLQENVLVG